MMKHRRQQGRITKIGASTGRHSLIFLVLNGSLRHCQCNLLDLMRIEFSPRGQRCKARVCWQLSAFK